MSLTKLHPYRLSLAALTGFALFLTIGGALADSPTSVDQAALMEGLADHHSIVRDALVDGTVTVAEVRDGLADTVACMESAGIVVDEASFTEDGHVSMQFSGGSTLAAADRADDIQMACFAEHAEPLADAYGIERMPTASQLDLYYEAVVSCLQADGFEVTSMEDADAVADRAAVRECSAQAEESILNH